VNVGCRIGLSFFISTSKHLDLVAAVAELFNITLMVWYPGTSVKGALLVNNQFAGL
jgi:hypothetical protein